MFFRKIHNKWQRLKILVENFARYQREVLQRGLKIENEVSSWVAKRSHTGTKTGGSGKDVDDVLDEINVSNGASQKDASKDTSKSVTDKVVADKMVADKTDNHHPSNAAAKGWKLRDNAIRKSVVRSCYNASFSVHMPMSIRLMYIFALFHCTTLPLFVLLYTSSLPY